MRRFMKRLRRGEKGFTLIELLIVIAILGIIAAIVVPNVGGFMTAGRLNAANTEAANIKTAAVGYLAEEGDWPDDSSQLGDFLEGRPKATYDFGGDSTIESTTDIGDGWGSDIRWNATDQVWERTPS